MHNYSVKVVLRSDSQRADGTRQLTLQAILNRQRAVIGLGFCLQESHWDAKKQRIKVPGQAQQNRDNNLIIQAAVARATSIFIDARLSGATLTPAGFKLLYQGGTSRSSFLEFYRFEMLRQADQHKPNTRNNHQYTLDKLRAFSPELSFSELTVRKVKDFDTFLRNQCGLAVNTVHKHHRFTRKFIRVAIAEGHLEKDPYDEFKPPRAKGMRESLTRPEIRRLVVLHDSGTLPPMEQKTLGGFLASVYNGGIRYSDLVALHLGNLRGNFLVFLPKKLERFGNAIEVPLSEAGKRFLNLQGPMLVSMPCNQLSNKALKDIAVKAGIDRRLTFHVARHTFATTSLQVGMKAEVVKRIMGISSWSVVNDYVHVNRERMQEEMHLATQQFA